MAAGYLVWLRCIWPMDGLRYYWARSAHCSNDGTTTNLALVALCLDVVARLLETKAIA